MVKPLGLVGDQAQLSVARDKIDQLQVELNRLPEVRQDRVQALQRALKEGRYRVSNEQIAEAVFSEFLGVPFIEPRKRPILRPQRFRKRTKEGVKANVLHMKLIGANPVPTFSYEP